MANNAIDIARKIVSRTDVEHGDTISNLKLQKLLYFVQGFHLASFGEPLFDEEMIAWTYGPVVPEVYDTYKKYRSRSINTAGIIDDVQLKPEAAALFDKVYLEYSRYSAVALMQMTHSAGPWLRHQVGEVLPKSEIRDYFLTLRLPDVAPAAAAPRQFDEAHKQLVPMQPGDVPTTYADASALERDFGFTPKITLREGLRKFAEWYKSYYRSNGLF